VPGGPGPAGTRVRLAALRDRPLSVPEVTAAVGDAAAGGVVVFVGAVRDHDADRPVLGLDYSAHPAAEPLLRAVAAEVAAAHPVLAVAAVHRVGSLAVGELAVVVAAGAAHRGAAFAAAEALIDEIKRRVPIWKHQRFADGTEEWVGTP
jgi:molybdopterin synthase catalytic subunit